MNREIKFRVWDEYNSIMLYDDSREQVDISFCGGKPAIIHHFTEHTIEREGIEMDVPISDLVTTFILMQFTGLKDKHGKEIYEGDRVTYTNPHSKTSFSHEVRWDEPWAAFGLFEKNSKWCKESDWAKIVDVEVIGNIYENPELVSNNKEIV